jgi:ribosomal protein S18
MSSSYSYSKTRTTYRPSTHPSNRHNEAIKDLVISIHVTPAPTYAELCNMRDQLIFSAADPDAYAWQQTLDAEIRRCRPLCEWMKMQKKEQPQPTQHARIDPAQVEQLEYLLKPDTLRRTYISIPVLMRKIQSDLHGINW